MKRELLPTQNDRESIYAVGLQTPGMKRAEAEASLAELTRLIGSTDGVLVGRSLLNVRLPDPATYLSSGLVADLAPLLAAADATTAVLDDDVTSTQQHNLETRWGVKVINRSELILDIFAGRASTSEGKLQVELAQHQYRLPRLRGRGVELSRLGGGIGTRGPGEMKLETDRRAINQHIHTLEERIARMKRQRETQRARRRSGDTPAVALVGYTNAGKSTLLNALTGASAFVEDKLFATLDPTTRRAALPSGMTVVFTDTVGFINRLPTQLAAAFRATLEEVLHTDALIHVVDATGPHYEREIEVTRGVLKDLGAGALPTVMAWNKIDALPPEIDPAFFEPILPPGVAISAREGIGLDRLLNEVQKLFDAARPRVWLRFGYDEYGEVSKIESTAHVLEKIHRGDAIYLLASLPAAMARRLQDRLSSAPPVDPTVEAI